MLSAVWVFGWVGSGELLDLTDAVCTKPLVLKLGSAEITAAEGAGGVIFGEYDSIAFDEDLYWIVAGNFHFLSHFLRDNDPSKLVYVSDNSCCFHLPILF